jgi:hypothetical protein
MIHSLLQRRRKESYKSLYKEDFEANVEISEEKILCQLKCTRKEYKESHAPSQGFVHTNLHETELVYFEKCFLAVEVAFFKDHFHIVLVCKSHDNVPLINLSCF